MVCTRKTKTLVSTCVILSGMTNIVCLLYVGWVTNYIASVYVKVQEPISEKKLEEDKGDTLRIIERLDHLENVIKQHIQGTTLHPRLLSLPSPSAASRVRSPSPGAASAVCACDISVAIGDSHSSAGRAGGCAAAAVRVEVPGGPSRGPARGAAGGTCPVPFPPPGAASWGRRLREVASTPRRVGGGRRGGRARRSGGAACRVSRAARGSGAARPEQPGARQRLQPRGAGLGLVGAVINLTSAACLSVSC